MNKGIYFEGINQNFEDRYKKSIKSIEKILEGGIDNKKFEAYFRDGAEFILFMNRHHQELKGDYFTSNTLEALQENNKKLYERVLEENYLDSFANPEKCVALFGKEMGQALTYLYTKIMNLVPLVYENQILPMTLILELFVQVYNALQNREDGDEIKDLIFTEAMEDLDLKIESGILRKFDVSFDAYSSILLEAELADLRYLYRYGMFIGHNEIETARYLLTLEEEKIDKMAFVFVDAYKRGYANGNKSMPLSEKKTINLSYPIGFERVIRRAAEYFDEIGLKPLVYTDPFTAARPRLISTKPSHQYAYDHRFDEGLYYNEKYTRAYEESYRLNLEKHKEIIRVMAGPAVQESFGDDPFSPKSKSTNISYSEEQTALKNAHTTTINKEFKKYLPSSATSFVIITYPLPSIGEKYKEIFDEIIKINTLDNAAYDSIQKHMIDALDQGEFVHVVGKNGNKTDIMIRLHELKNPDKETNFENCTADVNVPVGEVFTSPLLTGTNGKIHVKQVYLEGLKYENLEIDFRDGMIESYTCTNFDTEEERKKFIHENLLHPHKTLPMGEFAIGTNTTAYVMANKYKINHLLPILIAEKMGPHFAIGDTCYSWSEDQYVCNSDGKEIIARDNEKSALRKTDLSKAYFYKHTDITIPYEELALIEAITKNKEKILLLENGRFVLPGTQELNKPFR